MSASNICSRKKSSGQSIWGIRVQIARCGNREIRIARCGNILKSAQAVLELVKAVFVPKTIQMERFSFISSQKWYSPERIAHSTFVREQMDAT